MKTLVLFALAGLLITGCTSEREIQMGMEDVQLVKIDTVRRYNSSEQILTWRSASKIDYIMYVPMEERYPLGAVMKVMLKK